MAITKQKKGSIIEKIKKIVKNSATLVFVNFHGLSVEDTTKLRKQLKGKSIGYTVAKKTLIKRAFGDAGISGDMPSLDGEVALAYGLPAAPRAAQVDTDELSPASEIYAFQKDKKEQMKIIGGVFGGKFMDAAAMTGIATIPPKETPKTLQLSQPTASRSAFASSA